MKNNKIKQKFEMGGKEKFISKICISISIIIILTSFFVYAINRANPSISNINDDRKNGQAVMSEDVSDSDEVVEEDQTNNQTKDEAEIKEETKNVYNNNEEIDYSGVQRPISSAEVIMDYSYNTTPVYSKTLDEYISDHKGIDLKSYKNENVKSILDGKVDRVYFDEKYGYTIKIDHGNNLYSVYSNLNKNVNVKRGERVNKGDVIGSVGKSGNFEILDDYHLHFEIKRGDKNINPSTVLR